MALPKPQNLAQKKRLDHSRDAVARRISQFRLPGAVAGKLSRAKIWLPNPEIKGELVREAYSKLGLSSTDLDLLSNAVPQRQYLYTSAAGRRLFDLDLGPIARALCASTGAPDVAAAREVVNRVGRDGFVDEWLRMRGLRNIVKMEGGTQWLSN